MKQPCLLSEPTLLGPSFNPVMGRRCSLKTSQMDRINSNRVKSSYQDRRLSSFFSSSILLASFLSWWGFETNGASYGIFQLLWLIFLGIGLDIFLFAFFFCWRNCGDFDCRSFYFQLPFYFDLFFWERFQLRFSLAGLG